MVDVLLIVGSVVFVVGIVIGVVIVVVVGLLFGNILLVFCLFEDLEYVIVGCDVIVTVEFCVGLIIIFCFVASVWVMVFSLVIGVSEVLFICKV